MKNPWKMSVGQNPVDETSFDHNGWKIDLLRKTPGSCLLARLYELFLDDLFHDRFKPWSIYLTISGYDQSVFCYNHNHRERLILIKDFLC